MNLIASSYGSPLLKAANLNPYQRYPERDSWFEFEIYQAVDGTRFRRERNVSRWGGCYSDTPWLTISEGF